MTIQVSNTGVNEGQVVARCYVSRGLERPMLVAVNIDQARTQHPGLPVEEAVKTLAIAIFKMMELLDKARDHNAAAWFNAYE